MRFLFLLPALLAAGTTLAAGREVTDDAGRTLTLPDRPARVVVLHEPLIGVPIADFGLAPVGSYGRADDGSSLMSVDFYRSVLGGDAPAPAGIGALGNMDLEKLRALAPDLILGTEHDVDKTERLSAIAPVYIQNSSTGKAHGFGAEAALARVLGRQEAFAARRVAYAARLQALRATLPADPAGQSYLAIFLTDQINAVGEMSGLVQALEDLGYTRLSLDAESGMSGMGSTLLVPLSSEILGRLDPDLLVVMNSYVAEARDEAAARAALDRIVPGWNRFLKPAREGRILFLDPAEVTTPSVASAEHTLDALEAWAAAK